MGSTLPQLNRAVRLVTRDALKRPAEVNFLRGDASKAQRQLGWEPTITLEEMVGEMVEADLARHRAAMSQLLGVVPKR
jgi:GDPmannose 4,6-dehydratase